MHCNHLPGMTRATCTISPGMIFIPCSHNEAESVTSADAAAGARILAETAFEFANR